MTEHLAWWIARSSGIVSWTLLAASVIWGLLVSTRTRPQRVTAAWMVDLHRYLGGLSVVFVGVHVAALVADSYTHFGLTKVLVPLASSRRPGAVAWGIVGFYLLLAVEVTSLLRSHLSRVWWRRIHLLSLPLFAFSTIHMFVAGTDSSNRWLIGATLTALSVIGGLGALRVMTKSSAQRQRPVRTNAAEIRI